MVPPKTFSATDHVVGVDRNLDASVQVLTGHDPDQPVDGMTFGVAIMPQSAPHGGERHPDGDEILYLVSGTARLVFTDDPLPDVLVEAGQTVVVPRGLWHRVDVLEPCHIVYMTPGMNNEERPLVGDS